MGATYCPGNLNHPYLHKGRIKTCWRCDRCPKEHGFRLGRGDYCPNCTAYLKAKSYIWSEYCQNYIKP